MTSSRCCLFWIAASSVFGSDVTQNCFYCYKNVSTHLVPKVKQKLLHYFAVVCLLLETAKTVSLSAKWTVLCSCFERPDPVQLWESKQHSRREFHLPDGSLNNHRSEESTASPNSRIWIKFRHLENNLTEAKGINVATQESVFDSEDSGSVTMPGLHDAVWLSVREAISKWLCNLLKWAAALLSSSAWIVPLVVKTLLLWLAPSSLMIAALTGTSGRRLGSTWLVTGYLEGRGFMEEWTEPRSCQGRAKVVPR